MTTRGRLRNIRSNTGTPQTMASAVYPIAITVRARSLSAECGGEAERAHESPQSEFTRSSFMHLIHLYLTQNDDCQLEAANRPVPWKHRGIRGFRRHSVTTKLRPEPSRGGSAPPFVAFQPCVENVVRILERRSADGDERWLSASALRVDVPVGGETRLQDGRSSVLGGRSSAIRESLGPLRRTEKSPRDHPLSTAA